MDLGLAKRAVWRRKDGVTEVEHVLGELAVEERRLELLELGRSRQHVVRFTRGLGHEYVDHEDEIKGSQRLAHARTVGDRMGRVSRLDDHRPIPIGMIGQDLLRDHIAWDESTEDPLPGNRATRGTLRIELSGVRLH